MPAKPRIELYRSLEITFAKLSPRIGCGLALASLPAYEGSDALLNVMQNYGYDKVFADRQAQKTVTISALLKQFYDNAFSNKTALRQNFRQIYGHLDILLAVDASIKTAWFVVDSSARMAVLNYYRDAVSLGMKTEGRLLLGSTVRLTPVGWQNLHDLLTDEFHHQHPGIERVEILGTSSEVRWRAPTLGLGLPVLNTREFAEIKTLAEAAFRGETPA